MKIIHFCLCVTISLFVFGCIPGSLSETNKKIAYSRHPSQIYIEDSAKVYWTYYPDPFSAPTLSDRQRSETLSFECLIDEKIDIGFLDSETDSIIHKFTQPKKTKKYFWIWFAKSTADTTDFPEEYFKSSSTHPFKLALTLNNRVKSILLTGFKIPVGDYCYIKWDSSY